MWLTSSRHCLKRPAVSSPWLRHAVGNRQRNRRRLRTRTSHDPSVAGGEGARRRREEPEKTQECDPDESFTIPCVDDLTLKLVQPISEPDPALNSIDPSGSKGRSSGSESSLPAFLEGKRRSTGDRRGL